MVSVDRNIFRGCVQRPSVRGRNLRYGVGPVIQAFDNDVVSTVKGHASVGRNGLISSDLRAGGIIFLVGLSGENRTALYFYFIRHGFAVQLAVCANRSHIHRSCAESITANRRF